MSENSYSFDNRPIMGDFDEGCFLYLFWILYNQLNQTRSLRKCRLIHPESKKKMSSLMICKGKRKAASGCVPRGPWNQYSPVEACSFVSAEEKSFRSAKKKKKIVNVQWFDLVNQLRVQTIFLTNEWQCMVNIHSQTYHSGSLETVLKPLLTLLMWKCLSTDWNKIQQSLSLSAHSLIIDDWWSLS